MKNYIYGNWKMNQNLTDVLNFVTEFNTEAYNCEFGIAPQAIHIPILLTNISDDSNLQIGSQNCSDQKSGAFTGEISPFSLKDMNTKFVILGHSERRALFNEKSIDLKKKLNCALEAGLKVIFCIGESLEQREAGKAFEVIESQLKEVIDQNHYELSANELLIAYEPIWAIGTGKAATPELAENIHEHIRSTLKMISANLEKIPLLYGGSVKPENITELLSMKNINGALVGGASLKVKDFSELCKAASA